MKHENAKTAQVRGSVESNGGFHFQARGAPLKGSDFHAIFPGLMESFPRVKFYDYTKDAPKAFEFAAGKLPANYRVTFSLSESVHSQDSARRLLAEGVNVAVVFRKAFPRTFMGAKGIINGDRNDLRFLDRRGYVVALKAKGRAKKNVSGFVHDAITRKAV